MDETYSREALVDVLTLRPMRGDMPDTKLMIHVNGAKQGDEALVFEANGHQIGWLSLWDVARVAMALRRKPHQ